MRVVRLHGNLLAGENQAAEKAEAVDTDSVKKRFMARD
jgi:hypothetical protein